MDIKTLISDNSSRFDSWYDVASFCYDYLVATLVDQELFIGTYVLTCEQADNRNPNLDMLKTFEATIYEIISDYEFDVSQSTERIQSLLSETLKELVHYGVPLLNEATLVYFLLLAIDRYVAKWRTLRRTPAPLNRLYTGKSFLYFISPKSLVHDASIELRFRNAATDTSIKHCLVNLCILNADDYLGIEPPKLIALSFDIAVERPQLLQEMKTSSQLTTDLKVALIPFWGDKTTDFHVTCGATFEVRYSHEYLSFAILRAKTLLDRAIDSGANIIVFPEFLCAPQVQQEIGFHLFDMYKKNPQRLKELILVVAGSGWSEDNNVMCLFDRGGILIGKYYKYSKFHNDDHVEGLTTPGKECTVIDVNGLGRILPSICRDVSDQKYTDSLVDIFNPFLLITSAWSPSVDGGFRNQYDLLAKRYHVTSVLCNCCEALPPRSNTTTANTKVNLVAVPTKAGTIGSTCFSELHRKNTCNKKCSEHQCMFVISMNFSIANVTDNDVVLVDSTQIRL